jgi:hypothetical protein
LKPFPDRSCSAASARADRRWLFAAAAIVALSALPRLPNLGAPLLEAHDFRQTQTAITVQAWLEGGVDVLEYETPVFGPPWKVPFELPVFQLSAWAVAKLGVPLDLACRVAALAWFYLSAALLFSLVRAFGGAPLATLSVAAYVATPFSFLWSRACLIDYASVALSLGYVRTALEWARGRRPVLAATSVALGALAYATKITTLFAFLPAMALALWPVLRGALRGASGEVGRRRDGLFAIAWIAALGAVPLAAGLGWTAWADHVKAGAAATAWLVSSNLTAWTFGTFAQRAELASWREIHDRIRDVIVPGAFVLAIPLAIVFVVRRRGRAGLGVAAALLGAALPVVTFFNLYYVHDYYLIAVTPMLAVATGAGLLELAAPRFPGRLAALGIAGALAVYSGRGALRYARLAYADTRAAPIVYLAAIVREMTPPDRWIVVEGDDWNPRLPYLAGRRAFMLKPPGGAGHLGPLASRPEFGTLVCRTCPEELLALWPARAWATHVAPFDVFTIGPGAGPATPPRIVADAIGCERIGGWAWDETRPRLALAIEVLDGETPVARVTADVYRADLQLAGIYDGRHGFSVETPAVLRDGRPHRVALRVAGGAELVPSGGAVVRCAAR